MADVEKELLLRIRADSNLGPQLSQDADALQQLGNKMSEATEQVHKFRSGVDDTVEQLNIFGDRGSALVGEINKISDPLKRLELANKALASSSFQSGGALGQLSSKFNETKIKAAIAVGGVENLALITGVATAGVTALAAVVGGALVAAFSYASSSFTAYIEKQREVAKGSDDNAVKAKELTRSFDDLKESTDALEQSSGKLVERLLGASEKAGGLAVATSQLNRNLEAGKAPGDAFNSVLAGQVLLFPALIPLILAYLPLLLIWKKSLELLQNPYKRVTKATDTLTFQMKAQADAAEVLKLALGGVAYQLDLIAKKSSLPKPFLDAISSFKSTGDSRTLAKNPLGKGSGGGGPKKQEAVAISFSDTATNTLREIFNNLAIKIGGQISSTPLALQGAQVTAGAVEDTRGQQLGSALAAAQSGVSKGLDTGLSTATDQAKAFDDQVNNLKGSFLDLGVGITDAFLAFGVGAQKGKQALAGVLSNVGSLAAQLGTFFILLGGAESSTGFLGLKGTAAIAAGASLLAFGAGLKAGAASVGVSATNETKSRRQSVIKAPNANNLPQAQTNTQIIELYLDGNKVASTLAPAFNNLSDSGRLQLSQRALRR